MDNIICAYRIDSDFFDTMSSIPEVMIEPPLANGSITGESDAGTLVPVIDSSDPSRPEFKQLDKIRIDDRSGRGWKIIDTVVDKSEEIDPIYGRYAPYKGRIFIVRRKIEHTVNRRGIPEPVITTRILIWNQSLKDALYPVLHILPGVSWKVAKLKLDPLNLVAFFEQLKKRQEELESSDADEAKVMAPCLKLLNDYIAQEHEASLLKIRELLSVGEITFDLIWALITPGTVIFITCPTTSEPRAVRVKSLKKVTLMTGETIWSLSCEYIEINEKNRTPENRFGLADITVSIPEFTGVIKIQELPVFPFEMHPQKDAIKTTLITRARKWVQYDGTHYVHYTGLAHNLKNKKKLQVNGRIMIDRGSYSYFNPDYNHNHLVERHRRLGRATHGIHIQGLDFGEDISQHGGNNLGEKTPLSVLSDDELLLVSPILFGFSLVDKRWLGFNVNFVEPIQWNEGCMENLAVDDDQKLLLQSLINSHTEGNQVDDFIKGKGLGLVFNLFGPPGMGKSFTVEAVSEYLRRPVYVVSGGDLGTTAATLDEELKKIFDLAPIWNAIVLIDEADVFLEERSSTNLERNAMVAVFLRQIEYFRGILFLTTNRVQTFDQAFQSRIHLSLNYPGLSDSARKHLWTAFFANAWTALNQKGQLSEAEIQQLLKYDLNGRQIKNAVKVAASVAGYKKEVLSFQHVLRTLNTIKELKSTGVQKSAIA